MDRQCVEIKKEFVAGSTYGNFDGKINAGLSDVFLLKLNDQFDIIWSRLLGTSGVDVANSIICRSDYVFISGHTGGNLDGNTNFGTSDAFVTKYDNMIMVMQSAYPMIMVG